MIRALIVDDVTTVRQALRRLLTEGGEIEVVAEGRDGNEAVALTLQHRPDIVLMDVDMPRMDGLAATREIMANCPTPILIVTSSSIMDARHLPFAAIEAGALDVFPKPRVANGAEWQRVSARLRQTVRMIARVPVIRRRKLPSSDAHRGLALPVVAPEVIVVGASTGGPVALRQMLRHLPPDYPIPIAVVQHIGEEFVASFARWLDRHVSVKVVLARDGARLAPGQVVLAPVGVHMLLREGPTVRLDAEPPVHHCRPSVDVLFYSAAQVFRSRVVGILLTGMGQDGVEGLQAIHRLGGVTIAQDQESATVYGMPKAAVEVGAAGYVLSPPEIGRWLARLAAERERVNA